MSSEAAPKPYEVLLAENKKLRERVVELQKTLQSYKKSATRAGTLGRTGTESRIFELVKQKDKALSEYADRMEQKARELESLVQELNRRNEELGNHMAVLRLYQLIFENEPTAILGFDRDGRLIQFNAAAVRYFGVGLHALRLQPVAQLRLPGALDFDFEAMFERTVREVRDIEGETDCVAGRVRIRCYRLDDVSGLRGVIFRVSQLEEPAASASAPAAASAKSPPASR